MRQGCELHSHALYKVRQVQMLGTINTFIPERILAVRKRPEVKAKGAQKEVENHLLPYFMGTKKGPTSLWHKQIKHPC